MSCLGGPCLKPSAHLDISQFAVWPCNHTLTGHQKPAASTYRQPLGMMLHIRAQKLSRLGALMNMKRFGAACGLALLAAACGPTEKVNFAAGPQQQAIVRDGRNTIMSRKKNTTVVVSPASREIANGSRPVFVVGIQNNGKTPENFLVSNVSVVQLQAGAPSRPMAVIPYERLVSEERTRQVIGALLVGAAAAANSYSAQRSSYTSNGRYSPLSGAINGARADAQNAEMVGAAVAGGELNLAALEANVIKDNTVMPAEWVGGQLHIEPPQAGADGSKTYVITVPVGNEVHEITVTQGRSA